MNLMFKFLSEVAQSETNLINTSGDTRFTGDIEDRLIEYDSTILDVGLGDEKNDLRYGIVSHFDTGSIPLGAKIDRTRFMLLSSETLSESMTIDVSVLDLTTRLDAVDIQFNDVLIVYLPDSADFPATSVSLWNLGSKIGGSFIRIALHEDQRDGVSSVSQAWTSNASDTPLTLHWIVAKSEGLTSDARVRARVYTAKGSSGSYYKGAIVSEGELTDVSAWSVSMTSHTLSPVDENWSPTSGEVYVTEFELIPGASPGSGFLYLAWDVDYDGSVDNQTFYAAPGKKIQGFGSTWASPQWKSPIAIKNADHIGTIDTVTAHNAVEDNPSVFAGVGYSSSFFTRMLPNFKSNMQLALDARSSTDQWIGLRMQNWDAEEGQIRRFYSIDDTLAGYTVGDKKGWVLEIYYTLPYRSVSLDGSASSVFALVGSGTSAVALYGSATSVAALVGSGTSTVALDGTATSVAALIAG